MLNRLLHWLIVEPRHFWLALSVPGITVSFSLIVLRTEPAIRLSGLALQLLGILTAVWGIASTWKYFELGDPLAVVTSWLRRCPLRKRTVVTGVGTATERNDSLAARAYTWWQPKPEAEVGERLSLLEKNIPLLNDRITGVQRELDSAVQKLEQQVIQAVASTQHETKQVSTRLTQFGVGSLHISAIGAFWLFVGSILGSASQDLSSLLR